MSASTHPAASSISAYDLAAELRLILTGAASGLFNEMGWLRITGADATRWLNGMVTNNVAALAPGEGCYNFLLNAQGRILGDCTVYRDPTPEPPVFLLKTDNSQIETIHTHLDRFIIMDDVELARVENYPTAFVFGPSAPDMLRNSYHQIDPSLLKPLCFVVDPETGDQITGLSQRLVPAFAVRPNSIDISSKLGWEEISRIHLSNFLRLVHSLGEAKQVDFAALEAYRILAGIPRYGIDIRNTDKVHDLPQETAQDSRALHFAKGCYLGQEIVERIRSRGSVHRTFTGFVLTGALPPSGAELSSESTIEQPEVRRVGELTSVAAIPRAALDPNAPQDAPPLQIALGYIRREALDRGLPLIYLGGTATPVSLPFAIPGIEPGQL